MSVGEQKASGRPLTDYLYAKAIHLGIPLNGTFELSPVCNFSCRMCYVRKTRKEVEENDRKILTLQDWLSIAKQAKEAGMLELLLTGGEPLLWPDFWSLYEELIDMGFIISINTNGSLIDENAVQRFVKRPPQRLNITLYGASDETYHSLCGISGVFQRVDSAIRMLNSAGIDVKLNCSLTPVNQGDLDLIIEYAKQLNLVLSVSTYMFPPVRRNPDMIGTNERFTAEKSAETMMHYLRGNRGEERFQRYVRSIVDGCGEALGLDADCVDPTDGTVLCRAGRASFWISWDGWMMPCGMMVKPKVDIKNQTFGSAWEEILRKTKEIRLSGLCAQCKNRKICHPCAAIAYAETGSFSEVPLYRCQATQHMCQLASLEIEKSNSFSK